MKLSEYVEIEAIHALRYIVMDLPWQSLGYKKRPKSNIFKKLFKNPDEIALEYFLFNEFFIYFFLLQVRATPNLNEQEKLKVIEHLMEWIGNQNDKLMIGFGFKSKSDFLSYYRKSINEYTEDTDKIGLFLPDYASKFSNRYVNFIKSNKLIYTDLIRLKLLLNIEGHVTKNYANTAFVDDL